MPDGYRPFDKYSAILGTTPGLPGRPGGRPVGVRTGMGARPNVPSSPMLGGLRTSPVPLPGMGGRTVPSLPGGRELRPPQMPLSPIGGGEQRPMPLPPQASPLPPPGIIGGGPGTATPPLLGGLQGLLMSGVGQGLPMGGGAQQNVQNILAKYGSLGGNIPTKRAGMRDIGGGYNA